MEILNEYGAVNYFGINTFSVGIFKYWFSLDNKSFAIILSFVLLLLVLFFVFIGNILKKRDEKLSYHIKSNDESTLYFNSNFSKCFSLLIVSIPFILYQLKSKSISFFISSFKYLPPKSSPNNFSTLK